MYTDIATFLDVSPKWVENWLNTPIKETSHIVNTSFERTDIFQIHEIARNIMYHLDQLAEEGYWKAVVDYKNSDEELEHAFKKYLEKIMLQGGFVYKKDGREKNRILNNIGILADGLDPYEIPIFHDEPEEAIWQPDYWGDEDPDNPTNWQSEYSEDPSNSDEDPDYTYLESVEWI
ncbi:hypothetical protein RclHR1_39000001 [Rhizophagus clarus]|uniref:Uncharacterized protein n=1 Tax=Rhizophagus clarus TaxID=94130 RepID=A0A2Z6RQV6_9GLOM|nr:hypothetical protein RclHR1_39000001 [Rhizophagus clarus]